MFCLLVEILKDPGCSVTDKLGLGDDDAALRVAEDEQRIARLDRKARARLLRDDDLTALADFDGTENILAFRQT